MLSEVNRLRNLIVDRPPIKLADAAIWARLRRFRIVVFCDTAADVATWRALLGIGDLVLEYDHTQTYGVQANILRALEALDAEPYNSAYVCFKSDDLQEAVNTRIGTVQIGGAIRDVIPDVFLRELPDALERIDNLSALSELGLLAENDIIVQNGQPPRFPNGQVVWIPRFFSNQGHLENPDDLRDVRLLVLGRYFPVADARHVKHQLTKRIGLLKSMDMHAFVLTSAIGGALRVIDAKHPIDTITRVPPKTNIGGLDHLAWILTPSCLRADVTFQIEQALNTRIDLDLLRCTREYSSQKEAGSYEARAVNVRGAFTVSREPSGEHVVLLDDVVTSGSTAAECARILLEAGAGSVTVLAITKTQSVINAFDVAPPCANALCEAGKLKLRKGSDGKFFWGCSLFYESSCKSTQSWAAGIRAYNELNSRDDIPSGDDIEF